MILSPQTGAEIGNRSHNAGPGGQALKSTVRPIGFLGHAPKPTGRLRRVMQEMNVSLLLCLLNRTGRTFIASLIPVNILYRGLKPVHVFCEKVVPLVKMENHLHAVYILQFPSFSTKRSKKRNS